jgi:DNA-directed RNA polymerase subunit H (RpoH/RPB5)
MKRFLNYFFCTLGVIFFALICAGLYAWFADPFEIRPLVAALTAPVINQPEGRSAVATSTSAVEDKHPALSTEQEQTLERIGIQPENLPTTISSDQETCLEDLFGKARVLEVKQGATPTLEEITKGLRCIQ